MQITFPNLRFQEGQDVASRPDTCARADAGKAEGIFLSSRGATHGERPTPCALPPRPALARQYWPSQRDVTTSYGQTSCTDVARRPRRQRGSSDRFVSPLLSLGQPAVPLLARRPVATAGEGVAKGRIGRFGCARVLQPRAPFAPAVRDQSNTESGRAVERQAPRLRWTRAQAPGGAARGGISCGLHGSAQRFRCSGRSAAKSASD